MELPLIVSDHADWDELTATVAELRPGELWITHGREEALERWAELNGIPRPAPSPSSGTRTKRAGWIQMPDDDG